ncbi:class II myosin, partial [Coemansia sp. RSA 2559]
YLARKAMSASKIQRAWRGKRQFLELLKVREMGHQLLEGKKERQRHSLTNIRVFYGDYLYLNNCSSQSKARLIRDASGIGNQRAIFSLGITTLVPRSMRSAIPMRRILVVTNESIVIVDERLVNNLLQHVAESRTPVSTVQSVSMSPYKDGWMVIHVNGKPDIVLECNFKTELLTMLNMASQGRIRASFNTTITYNNKKMKQTQIKFVKDEGFKHAVFEKKVVRVGSGEHPSSRSQPLVEKSTGGHGSNGMRQRPNMQQQQRQQQQQQQQQQYQRPQQQQQQRQQAPRRPSASNQTNGNSANNSYGQQRATVAAAPTRKQAAPPPPAPPPAPPAAMPRHPRYKAL